MGMVIDIGEFRWAEESVGSDTLRRYQPVEGVEIFYGVTVPGRPKSDWIPAWLRAKKNG